MPSDASPSGAFGSLRTVWANEAVRRAQLALAGSTIGDWSYSVAMSVLVYQRAGAAWVGIAQLCRLAPAALAAPFLATLVDRYPKQRVLFVTDALRAAFMGGLCVSAALGAPLLAILALVTVTQIISTVFRPAQAAMMPALVEDAEELTVANVTSITVESTGSVIGPMIGAVVLAIFGTTYAFIVPVVAYALSAVAVTRVHPRATETGAGGDAGDASDAEGDTGLLAGLAAIVRFPDVRVLVGLYCAQVLIAGALNVLTVVAALELLHRGDSGVGVLVAATGVGGLIGAVPALILSRRARLTTTFVLGLLLWGIPITLIGLVSGYPFAIAMLALVGLGNTLVDVSGITLLQRATPGDLLGRVFGVLEGVIIGSIALGAAGTPVLLHLFGVRTVFVITGLLLPIVTLPLWRRLRHLDAPTVDARRIELLRGDPIFTPLPMAMIEQLAGSLEPVAIAAGDVVFHEGDAGDRYYLIDSGSMLVERTGHDVIPLGSGHGFGEIALIRGVPRTATLRAESDAALFAMRGDEFVAAITGHATSAETADAIVTSRLLALRSTLTTA